ncbi:MAG TPA: acyl-CoA dehydrogenase family protein [Pyrinomonadaceae bacterium]|jgi:alkylation response protein AidB-like acyl-CoA dehydrogenase
MTETLNNNFDLNKLDDLVEREIIPHAAAVDEKGEYPRRSLEALSQGGFLGLISDTEVGGLGASHRAAAIVVEKLASACASTAMIVCMHYAGTAVIEKYGARKIRRDIAEGKHLTTLAFSESSSRSQFWSPTGTAQSRDDEILLDANKSWVTSAGQADSYVWSSRPVEAEGNSTIWLVPSGAEGLSVTAPFNGLGLRGNASSPITARNAAVSTEAMLGADGQGFEIMMSVVLPLFSVMNAAFSIGTMEAAVTKSINHLTQTRFEHSGQNLSGLPTIRAYLSRMRIKTDMCRALLFETLASLEEGREDATLRVLEVKAAAGEASTEVTESAMRICGGAAFRKEVGVERNFRDARAATVMAPTTDALYDFIGKALCGMPLFE